jgi:hypothetical protein
LSAIVTFVNVAEAPTWSEIAPPEPSAVLPLNVEFTAVSGFSFADTPPPEPVAALFDTVDRISVIHLPKIPPPSRPWFPSTVHSVSVWVTSPFV